MANLLLPSQVFTDKIGHEFEFTVGKLIAKRGHSVAAIGDVIVEFGLRFEFEFTLSQARDLFAVGQCFSLSLGAVTYRAVLPKKRRLVGFAVFDNEAGGLTRIKTRYEADTGSEDDS